MVAAVEVTDFHKNYGEFVAVDGISFAVGSGEIFGLLGPNGAGKTSTLESLEGLRPPSGGTLRVAGIDPTKEPGRLRDVIGVREVEEWMSQYSGIPLDELREHGQAQAGAAEQLRLGLGIGRHAAVIVEVIAAEIGEHRGIEGHGRDPVLVQRVRRNLHGHGRRTRRLQCRQ